MSVTLAGVIERVTFHNPETGFAVLRVLVRGQRDSVTVVGKLPSVTAGEQIDAVGEWVVDRTHGRQLQASELRTMPPHTVEGIERYLASGLVKGIGPHYARKIVAAFGERTLEVIDASPTFLSEVKGIGPKRLQRIRASWVEQKAVRDIMVFLQQHGIGTARAARIYKTYGDRAVEIVRSNPYRLTTDVWGFGFQTADQLAVRLGLPRDSIERAMAALRHVLQEQSQQGHCAWPEASALVEAEKLTSIAPAKLSAAVEQLRQEEALIREPFGGARELWLYLTPLFLAELGVARAVTALLQGGHPLPKIDGAAALTWVESKMKLTLAPSQRRAIEQALTQKVLVITGGPGVGKTTIVRGILEIFAAKKLRCALCAPTGRAAKRLSEATGREAKTIHRLLEFEPGIGGFRRTRELPLELDLLIVDEASMVDVVLMNQLLRAVPAWACVVLVGDVDQLPSVGPGAVLGEIIASGVVPVVRLHEIFRQAGQSWIIQAAHRVNQGELPEPGPPERLGDFYFIEAETPEAILDVLLTLLRERVPKRFGLDPLRDVQVLTPMHRSELGVQQLNERLQAVLNPPRGDEEIQRFSTTFRVGDKVLQTVNNYKKEVFNGDIGRITGIDTVEQQVTVEMDGRIIDYELSELDELTLAYALTIHKSQGGEYPAVVIPLHTQHYLLLQRNLLYTAITRGKKLVVIVGSRKALTLAVQRQDTTQRCTALAWRLQELAEK